MKTNQSTKKVLTIRQELKLSGKTIKDYLKVIKSLDKTYKLV